MAYSQQQWSDYPTGGTPISAARLNHMEAGIAAAGSSAAADAAQATANQANTTANSALTAANNAQTGVNTLSATFEPATGAFTPATNFTVVRNSLIKIGRVASCDIQVTYTGSTITVSSSGNITNTLLGTVSSVFTNWGHIQGIPAGSGGALASYYIYGTNLWIAAYAPSTNITSGTTLSLAGTWITAS